MDSTQSKITLSKSIIDNSVNSKANSKNWSWLPKILVVLVKVALSVLLIGFVLLYFKQVNLYKFFNLPSKNNFLDLVLTGADCILLPWLVICGLEFWFKGDKNYKTRQDYSSNQLIQTDTHPHNSSQIFADSLGYREEAFQKDKTNSKFYHILLTSLAIWLIGSTLAYSVQAPATGLLLQSLRLLTWLLILPKLLNNLKLVLGLYSLFDHFLITSSLPVLITSILFAKNFGFKTNWLKFNWKKHLVIIILTLNFIAATHQVFVGKSIGLFAEPVLDVQTLSQTARQGGLLRGYGLTQHPNILGGLSLIILTWAMNQKIKYSPFIKLKKWNLVSIIQQLAFNFKQSFGIRLILILSILCLVLSFSRLAWLGLFFLWWYKLLVNPRQPNWFLSVKIIAGFGLIIGWFSIFRKDVYRIQDWQLWWDSFSQLNFLDQILGYGYYPQFLVNNFNNLQSWQWQPSHNVWMNIGFEFGIIGLVVTLILVWQSITINLHVKIYKGRLEFEYKEPEPNLELLQLETRSGEIKNII
jgi:hypothetical protein